MTRAKSMLALVLGIVILLSSYSHGIEEEHEMINVKVVETANKKLIDKKERIKRTTNQQHDLINYIQPADEQLKNNPEFQAILRMVFEPKPETNIKEVSQSDIQANENTLDVNTDNDIQNSTGMDDRLRPPKTLINQHTNFIPATTKNENNKGVANTGFTNENGNALSHHHQHHPDVEENSSVNTDNQAQVILEIFGTPPEQEKTSGDDTLTTKARTMHEIVGTLLQQENKTLTSTTETEYPSMLNKTRNKMDDNAANVQTISVYVCFTYSILFIILFP